jgi:hypothetical protein
VSERRVLFVIANPGKDAPLAHCQAAWYVTTQDRATGLEGAPLQGLDLEEKVPILDAMLKHDGLPCYIRDLASGEEHATEVVPSAAHIHSDFRAGAPHARFTLVVQEQPQIVPPGTVERLLGNWDVLPEVPL